MTEAATYVGAEGVSRRDLLRRALIGGGVVAAAMAAPGLTGVAQAKGGKRIVLDVEADLSTFEVTGTDPAGGTGAFYVAGDIYAPGTTGHIGDFHCWGYITAGGTAVVNQEFAVHGRGKILIAGVESSDPRAVIGGTGDFANARGEGNLVDFDPAFGSGPDNDTFTIVFSLTGASGPPIT